MEQKSFYDIKRAINQDNLSEYPYFNKVFDIHTYARDYQLGAMIIQDYKPIDFYSRKLTGPQTRYTVTEKELISIVKTLKELRTILLGQQLKIYTDHNNITCKNFNTDCVLRWRIILEEYIPQTRKI